MRSKTPHQLLPLVLSGLFALLEHLAELNYRILNSSSALPHRPLWRCTISRIIVTVTGFRLLGLLSEYFVVIRPVYIRYPAAAEKTHIPVLEIWKYLCHIIRLKLAKVVLQKSRVSLTPVS